MPAAETFLPPVLKNLPAADAEAVKILPCNRPGNGRYWGREGTRSPKGCAWDKDKAVKGRRV